MLLIESQEDQMINLEEYDVLGIQESPSPWEEGQKDSKGSSEGQ